MLYQYIDMLYQYINSFLNEKEPILKLILRSCDNVKMRLYLYFSDKLIRRYI